MTRKKKLFLNTVVALAYQVITIVCGFILPKFFIPKYGSAVNGMISSITQFLGIITLMESGVGAVVQSALYKPLADRDETAISKVMISSNRFFNRILAIVAVYVCALMVVYPFVVDRQFDFLYSAMLVLILALTYIAQHYLFVSYRLLLNANQMSFLQLGVHSCCLILNCVISIVLIRLNVGVHVLKAVSALIYLIQPLVLKYMVDRQFKLDMHIRLTEEPIKQKWNGFAQHIASVVLGNTDTIVLTVFSTLENVSVYSVYYLVVHGIRQIINSMLTGVQALLGNMYAKNEKEQLGRTFGAFVLAINFIVVYLYAVAGILLIPFVRVYTKNFTDANYIVPAFGVLITLAYAAYSIRLPYEMMVKAAGHYKETQTSSIIEASLNVVLSVILVSGFGLVGVAIGTLAAMVYRTCYLVRYLSKNILNRPIKKFVTLISIDVGCVAVMIGATSWLKLANETYWAWIQMAVIVGTICLVVMCLTYMLFFRSEISDIKRLIGKKAGKLKRQ